MWKLSIEDDQGNKTVVNLVRDEYSLGRAEENTVRLTERNISRQHAALQRNGSGWLLSDNQSYNGCYVNGVRVADPQRLEHGDLVQVGDYRLEITDDTVAAVGSRAATVPAVPKSQMLLGQPDRLVMLVGPTPGTEFALAGERVVIGRGEECDIALNHSSVSRVHAEIHSLGDGRYELVDRESANGIRLNGVELKRGLIDARDSIELGDVVFKFIPAGVIYRAGADESQQLGAVSVRPPERMTPAPQSAGGMPASVKAIAAVFGLGLLVVLGMLAVRRDPPPPTDPVAAIPSDGTAAVLKEAKALADDGNLDAAHLKLIQGIPEDSNVRQSQAFKDLEARWADSLFSAADQEPDATRKREILERITKATSVDSTRRKRAATEMEKLAYAGVAVSDLPPTPTLQSDPSKPPLPGGIVRKDPFASAPKPAAGKPPTASFKPPPAPAPAPKPTSGTPDDLGDRAKLKSMKDSLKYKVGAGKATEAEKRMLKALCRQLGDGSCVN